MLPWVIAGAVAGLLAGPRMRASVFAWSTGTGQPPRPSEWPCRRQEWRRRD
jgi:hypothetical protein